MAKPAATNANKLTVSVRAETGKGASRRARREGRIPAVLYGRDTEPQHLLLPGHEFAAIMRNAGTNAVLSLDIDGTEQLALTRALDIHPIRRDIRHVDLLVIRRGEKVTVEVNIVIEGEAAPGTLVTQDATWVEVEAEVLSIPDQLVVDISGAEAGTQFAAGDLTLPSGVELVSEADWLLVNVVEAPTAEELEPEAAEPGTAPAGEDAESAAE